MAELLADQVRERGDEVALIDDDGSQTWADTNARINQLIHGLRRLGCEPGSRIALMARNSRAWWEITLAAIQAGVVAVPVNWHWMHEELAHVLEDSEAQVLVVAAEFVDVVRRAVAMTGSDHVVVVVIGNEHDLVGALDYETLLGQESTTEPVDQRGARPMMYTSGTTGTPKGVVPRGVTGTVEEFAAGASAFVGLMGMEPGATTLIAGPAYHSAQWSFALLPFVTGSTLVTPSACPPAAILELVDSHRVANVHLVPTQFVRLLRLPDEVRQRFRGDSLQVVVHGGAPCSIDVKHSMIEWWGPVVTEYFGGTETGMATLIRSEEWLEHPGSVGRPIPGAELRILGADGRTAAPGETGIIWVRREGADFEYHNAPGKTQDAHDVQGFASTGDMGHVQKDYLYVTDRKIDMIISGGVNIYPAEIEGVLLGHPAVLDSAVIGTPDPEYGEQVVAYVELNDPTQASPELAESLADYCRTRLAGFKCPRSFHFADALPRSAAGKLQKNQLRRV